MQTLWQDLRFSGRMLIKNPGFTAVAVLTLALGVGANTAIFTVVNTVLLRPLRYEQPERLVSVFDAFPNFPRDGLSELEYNTLRNESQSFAGVATSNWRSITLTGVGEPERVQGAVVSSNYLDLLGAQVEVGRGFAHDEDQAGKNNVVILSHDFWTQKFGANPNVIGQSVTLGGSSFVMIGALRSGFKSPMELQFATGVDLWIGYGFNQGRLNGGSHNLSTVGRLGEGVTIEQAQEETKAIIGRVMADNSQYYPRDGSFSSYLVPLHDALVGDVRTGLLVLFGAVAAVLLIACVNVANLLLVRSEGRQKEIAVRAALGARRWQIIRQLLTESMLLAVIGGAAGVLAARWGLDAFVALNPGNIPRLNEVALDSVVLSLALGVSLLTGVVFGLAPALQTSKSDLLSTLKEGGRTSGAGRGRGWLRQSLVVAETALALVLLVAAGLLLRSFWELQHVPTGFNADRLLTLRLSPAASSYQDNEKVAALYDRIMTRTESVPGVQSAAVSNQIPISGGNSDTIIQIEGRPFEFDTARLNTDFRVVSPGYFDTMGLGLIGGRYFSESDREGSPYVTIINEVLARRHWPGEDPLGKRLRLLDAPPEQATSQYMTVVGVVVAAKNRTLAGETHQDVYVPLRQQSLSMGRLSRSVSMGLIVRATTDPASLTHAIRREVWDVDPNIPITQVRTMQELIDSATVQPRFNTILLSTFAILALGLGALGIYGVVSYSVAQRTHELGIRIALGARGGDVLKLVVGEAIRLAFAGVAIGLGLAIGLTRLMETLLFGVTPTDPLTFASIPVLLVGVALAASFIPARRAMKVDPMVALRCE